MSPPIAVIDRERIPREHSCEPWERLGLLRGQRLGTAKSRARHVGRALVVVIFAGPVHAPCSRIGRLFADLDQAHVWIPPLLFALENRRQQSGHEEHQYGTDRSNGNQDADPPPRSEEHTSELQSPCNLVCRLLLEK